MSDRIQRRGHVERARTLGDCVSRLSGVRRSSSERLFPGAASSFSPRSCFLHGLSSSEQRQAQREANAEVQRQRLANMSSEQRQAQREADAEGHRQRLANMTSQRVGACQRSEQSFFQGE